MVERTGETTHRFITMEKEVVELENSHDTPGMWLLLNILTL